jgi:hypothetical protein
MASNSNEKKAQSNTNKAIAALQPKTYTDPYGSFNGVTGQYSPVLTDAQKQTRETELNKINSITGSINPTPTTDDLFNNSYYSPLKNYYQDTIDTQRAQDQKTLSNNLAARNQTGSSLDAYQQSLLNKNYNSQGLAAEAQARGDSANYFTQNLQNQLNSLSGLRNDALQAQAYEYQPFQNYLGYQNAVSPLQQAQATTYNIPAQYYYGQAATRDGILNSVNNVANTYRNVVSAWQSPVTNIMGSGGNSYNIGGYGGGQAPTYGQSSQGSATSTGNNLQALARTAMMFA